MQVSFDGGKTFSRMNEKHVDNHAIVLKMIQTIYCVGYLMRIIESFDKTKTGNLWIIFLYTIL